MLTSLITVTILDTTMITTGQFIIAIFLVAATSALLFGIILSHQMGRFGTSNKVVSTFDVAYTIVAIALLGVGAYSLFFFFI